MAAWATTAVIGVLGHAKRATQWKNEEQTSERVMSQKRSDFRQSNGRDTTQLMSRAGRGNNKRTMGVDKGSMVLEA